MCEVVFPGPPGSVASPPMAQPDELKYVPPRSPLKPVAAWAGYYTQGSLWGLGPRRRRTHPCPPAIPSFRRVKTALLVAESDIEALKARLESTNKKFEAHKDVYAKVSGGG